MPQKRKEKHKIESGIKIVTQNKLLTRLPALLAQIKAGNNSCKLKKKTYKLLKSLTIISSSHYNLDRQPT